MKSKNGEYDYKILIHFLGVSSSRKLYFIDRYLKQNIKKVYSITGKTYLFNY